MSNMPIRTLSDVARVHRVTLFEDRAQVSREATLSLEAGTYRWTISGVSPLAVDKSVVARTEGHLRVYETRVRREWRLDASTRPADAQRIVDEAEALLERLRAARAELNLLTNAEQHKKELSALALAAVEKSIASARRFDPAWTEDLEAVFTYVKEAESARVDARHALEQLGFELDSLVKRATSQWRIDYQLATELIVDFIVETAGTHRVILDYMVPCALWRPMYRAALHPAARRVDIACDAAVWQATGEDWKDVALSFSTARSSQMSSPPFLSDDVLTIEKKVEVKLQVEVREQVIATTGEGMTREADSLQGVDDGGETRLMQAGAPTTISPDGRMMRVPLFAFSSDAEIDRIARPEKSALVHVRSRQANTSAQPLLAGPVELIGESGYVGTSSIGFIAPQERFVLGWGGDESIRIRRRPTETRDVSRLTGKKTLTRKVELFLSNLSERPGSFRLEERIPVSELSEVEIILDPKLTKPQTRADENGFVHWQIELPPIGTQTVELVYQLLASSDVAL